MRWLDFEFDLDLDVVFLKVPEGETARSGPNGGSGQDVRKTSIQETGRASGSAKMADHEANSSVSQYNEAPDRHEVERIHGLAAELGSGRDTG